MVSVIILSYNTEKILSECLSSVFTYLDNLPFEVVIVDNNSTDGSTAMVKNKFPKAKIIENKENIGFAKGVNQGVKEATGTHLLLLNSDTKMHDRSCKDMLDFMEKTPDAAIVGGKLENTDGTTSKSYGKFYNLPEVTDMLFNEKNKKVDSSTRPKKVDWVSGGYMLIRKKVFEGLHGFDEHFFMYIEDMELCYRASQAGFATWYYPQSSVMHMGQGSSNRSFAIINIYKGLLYFYKKHKSHPHYLFLKFLLVIKAIIALTSGVLTRNSYLTKTYRKALAIAL